MNLPNDIRLKIEKSPDKDDILLLLARLENDGVTITNDVYAAIAGVVGFRTTESIRIVSAVAVEGVAEALP